MFKTKEELQKLKKEIAIQDDFIHDLYGSLIRHLNREIGDYSVTEKDEDSNAELRKKCFFLEIEIRDRERKREKEEEMGEKMDLVMFETHDCQSIMTREEAEDKAHTEARYFAVASLITKHQKEFKDLWGKEYEKLKKVRIMPVEKYK